MAFHRYFELLSGLLVAVSISSCQIFKHSQRGFSPDDAIMLDTIDLNYTLEEPLPYRPSFTKAIDILHVELDLSFSMENEEVYGKAKLLLTSYAEPQDTILLDARGFEIHKITVFQDDSLYEPRFEYDQNQLTLMLNTKLNLGDSALVSVDYTARPSKLEKGDGEAITSSQGLYFINPRGDQEDVPQQIWTQGETEYNSGWFPSVDKPNEKFTQEVFITVDTQFVSVSNGKLVYSTINNDGTRTDYWKQEKPHSNYLVMLAVGDFAVVKDTWRDIDVWYFVDDDYKEYADEIFGNTPEMLEFFSKKLGYDYPWEKFYQIVVKDFVSGAMENTSAVVHGDFVQQTPREMLDGTHEDVVAHELFHHWFGDLVTSESWAQITMNEGFATYGEFLWQEYKYGSDEAYHHLNLDLEAYLTEARDTPKLLIRDHYQKADDVFDRHSYQKGGRVIHMLRNELGDDLFFKGLAFYLRQNEYKNVEDDHLRLALEEVSGRDLKWFFDQWFHQLGHPVVSVDYDVDSIKNKLIVKLTQNQIEPVFKFHVDLEIGLQGKKVQRRLWINDQKEEWSFEFDEIPLWYAIDPKGDMLWQMEEEKNEMAWLMQLQQSEISASKVRAMWALNENFEVPLDGYSTLLLETLKKDEFWLTKAMAAASLLKSQNLDTAKAVERLNSLLSNETNSDVRSVSLTVLDSLTHNKLDYLTPFVGALKDSSYLVLRTTLYILLNRDACAALPYVKAFDHEGNFELLLWSARIHALCGEKSSLAFFEEHADVLSGVDAYMYNGVFTQFASTCNEELVYDALVKHLGKKALDESSWWSRISAVQGLELAKAYYSDEIEALTSASEISELEMERLAFLRNKKASVSALIEESKEIAGEDD